MYYDHIFWTRAQNLFLYIYIYAKMTFFFTWKTHVKICGWFLFTFFVCYNLRPTDRWRLGLKKNHCLIIQCRDCNNVTIFEKNPPLYSGLTSVVCVGTVVIFIDPSDIRNNINRLKCGFVIVALEADFENCIWKHHHHPFKFHQKKFSSKFH